MRMLPSGLLLSVMLFSAFIPFFTPTALAVTVSYDQRQKAESMTEGAISAVAGVAFAMYCPWLAFWGFLLHGAWSSARKEPPPCRKSACPGCHVTYSTRPDCLPAPHLSSLSDGECKAEGSEGSVSEDTGEEEENEKEEGGKTAWTLRRGGEKKG
eukprot:GHVQ01030404.1.p2 GENE.GHVQ01030404.1~~GHVQ01030404.1.p2  ORF type:complete len:155 (+),score=36.95 GHVQ01030404.1:384-848(+)